MKDSNEIIDLIPELIEEVIKENGGNEGREQVLFNRRAKEIVKEVAEYSRSTNIYKIFEERRREFWEQTEKATPSIVYGYMIDRVAKAPTRYHMNASVILIIPRLDELLNGVEEEKA